MWIMKEICVRVPEWMLELIDALVKGGIFMTRSEFVRFAIRLALWRYEEVLEDIYRHSHSAGSPNPPKKRKKQYFGLER